MTPERAERSRCRDCGAPLHHDLTEDITTCEACGARHVVPVDARRRARSLARDAGAAADRELDARWAEALHRQSERIVRWTMASFAAGLIAAVPVVALWATRVFDKVSMWIGVTAVALFSVAWLVFFEAVSRSLRPPHVKGEDAPNGAVRCEGCGAVSPVRAGVLTDACAYCDSANLVPVSTAWTLVLGAQGRAQAALTDAAAAARTNTASVERARRSAGVHNVSLFVGALVVVTFASIAPAVFLARRPDVTSTAWIGPTLAALLAYGSVRCWIAFRRYMSAARSSGALAARQRISHRQSP